MSLILEDVAAMIRLSQLSREEYLKDSVNEALAERYLERAIGRMIESGLALSVKK
jgi:phage gp46-like protein